MNKTQTYEQYLAEHGTLTYTFKGVSMNPMLKQDRDLFTVAAKGPERCKKYDVVLYRRPPNQHVLHRVIQVRENDYVILGDNCIAKEYGIRDEDILGVLTSFTRCNKTIPVTNPWYTAYTRVWLAIYPLRVVWKSSIMAVKKVIKKMIHWNPR